MNSKYSDLISNTKIFAIGNIITKLAQYVIIALCTYKLSTADYGLADTSIQTVAMLVPIFSFDIADGLFRYSIDKNIQKNKLITSATLVNLIGTFIAVIAIPIEYLLLKNVELSVYTSVLTVVEIFHVSIKEYIRGIGKTKLYLLGGFVNAISQVILCIVFVYIFNLGLLGYMLTICLSYIIELLLFAFRVDYVNHVKFKNYDKAVSKELLKYSLPLVPNKIMWWVISASDRYFVLWMIGASATGIYAVAAKFPAVLTIVTGFFFQAWQLSAINEYDKNGYNDFYNKVFDLLWSSMGIMTAGLLLVIKYLVFFLVSKEFFSAWTYSPFLIVAAYFGAIQSFLGVNYTIEKNSIGILRSTCAGALANLIMNFVLIKFIGVQGATIATMISYIIVCVYRYYDTKRVVTVKSKTPKSMLLLSVLLIVEASLIIVFPSVHLITSSLGIIVCILLIRKHLISIISFVKNRKPSK